MTTKIDDQATSDSTEAQSPDGDGLGGSNCSAIWIDANAQKPTTGKKVIVCGHYSNGNRWRALAKWQPAGTIDAELWDETPDDWWDEDGNVCTNPHDVWFEESVELETTGFLENVTHWMPLPDMPNAEVSHRDSEKRS